MLRKDSFEELTDRKSRDRAILPGDLPGRIPPTHAPLASDLADHDRAVSL